MQEYNAWWQRWKYVKTLEDTAQHWILLDDWGNLAALAISMKRAIVGATRVKVKEIIRERKRLI